MAARTPAPVWFQTRVSRTLFAYLAGIHSLAFAALWLTGLPSIVITAGCLALLGHLGWQLRTQVFQRGTCGVRALHWQADERWRVLDGSGRVHCYEQVQVGLASPLLILARLRGSGGQRWLLLAADSAAPEALRQLRVRLRRTRQSGRDGQGSPLPGT